MYFNVQTVAILYWFVTTNQMILWVWQAILANQYFISIKWQVFFELLETLHTQKQ